MMTLTTQQVLEATGFKNVRTLQRWRERNLVPPPTLQRHPNGQGMTWIWPSWTVRHINAIKKRLADGESLDDIAGTLSGDWQAEAQKWVRKRYDFKAAHARMVRNRAIDQFAEWVSDTVYDFLRDIGVERPGRIDTKIWRAVSKFDFISDVLELLRQGCTPILVVTKAEVTMAPDFLLGAVVGRSEISNQPVLVVPMRDAFIEAFAEAEPDLPKAATFLPAMHVAERSDQSERIRRFRIRDGWKFTLEK